MDESQQTIKKEASQEIKKLVELFSLNNLNVPLYQRPYKWEAKNVIQLLDDIFENLISKEKSYRVGSLIVHYEHNKKKNQDELNIVDGQQRLTTISILLYHLGIESKLLMNQEYKQQISKDNIVYNSRVIQNWLTNIADKEKFKQLLLEKCEFVLFTVYEQDEAFQLFDSQNSRGKALEAYDLLKAFHLREMEFDTEKDKIINVENWEKSVDDGELKPILGNHLYKIRKWVRGEHKYDFTKNDIDEFKGISLHKEQQYPYERSLRMLDLFVNNSQNENSYPFSITMPIINGKRFFEYVNYYIQFKKDLFKESEFSEFYKQYALSYHRSTRTGDWKVRNLYENILLLYLDKFGNIDFNDFQKAIFRAVYTIRCNNKSIRLESILNSKEIKILQEINDSLIPEKLKKYQYKNHHITKQDNEMVNGIIFIKKYIIESEFHKN